MTNKVNTNASKRSSKQENTRKTNTRSSRTKTPTRTSSAYSEFWSSSLAKFLKTVLFIIAIILFDLIISRNNYSKFYLFLGIELILAFIFVVFRLIVQQNKIDK